MAQKENLFDQMGIGPGQPFNEKALKALYENWAHVYLTFMLMVPRTDEAKQLVQPVKDNLVEANELVVKMMDGLGVALD